MKAFWIHPLFSAHNNYGTVDNNIGRGKRRTESKAKALGREGDSVSKVKNITVSKDTLI